MFLQIEINPLNEKLENWTNLNIFLQLENQKLMSHYYEKVEYSLLNRDHSFEIYVFLDFQQNDKYLIVVNFNILNFDLIK